MEDTGEEINTPCFTVLTGPDTGGTQGLFTLRKAGPKGEQPAKMKTSGAPSPISGEGVE